MAKTNKSPITPQVLIIIVAILLVGGIIGYYLGSSSHKNAGLTNTTHNQSSEKTLYIPEIGIKLNISELPTLRYQHMVNSAGDDVARLYTPETAVYCPLDGPDSPFGVLFKVTGQYKDIKELPPGVLIKQYDEYFISYRQPQYPCTSDENGMKIISDQLPKVEQIINSIQ